MSDNAPPRIGWSRFEKLFLAVAMAVGLAMRLSHWLSFSGFAWFDFLGLDSKYYDEWAQRILADGLQGEAPYFMGPLYPHVLAAVYWIGGRSLDLVRAGQVGLSVATIALVHVLARRWVGRTGACIASGMAAVYGPFVYYSVSILYPTLTVFLSTLLLLLLFESARRRSLAWTAVAGLCLGTYALGRGNILLFAPLAFFWLIAAWGRPFAPALGIRREGALAGLVLAGTTLAAILPATLHNVRAGDPTLLTTNGGLNFYIGNGPMASGGHETPVLHVTRPDGEVQKIVADLHKDVECRTEAELVTGRTMTYTEVSSFWFDETSRFIRASPGTFLSKLVMKATHFWSTYEIPQIEHFGYFRQFSAPLRGPVLSFGIVGPLAVIGMALSLRRFRRFALLHLFVISYSTSIVLFFVLARYRLPILPALLPFAAFAVIEILRAARSRRWRLVLGSIAAALAVGWAMQANFYRVDEVKGIAQILYRHGIVEDARGNWEAAIGHYEEALRLKPGYDRCHLNLGVDLARVGRRAEGMRHILTAEQLSPAYYRPPFNRGLLLEDEGRHAEAEAAYRRALELEPRYLLATTALAEMRIVAGDTREARELFERVVSYEGRWEGEQNPRARSRALRYLAYLDERDRLERMRLDHCFVESEDFRLAEILRLRGRAPAALDVHRRYFEEGGRCAEAYLALGRLLLERNDPVAAADALQRAAAADDRFPGTHLALARLAASTGDARAAIRHLEREIEIDPMKADTYLEMGLVHERLLSDPARAEQSFARFRELGGDPRRLELRRRAAPAGGSGS